MAMKIDELNSPKEFDSEEYIKNYFKPMRISEDRKEERENAARDFRDVLLFILALIAIENEYNALNWAYIEEQFRRELEKAALRYARSTQALQDYIAEKASDFIGITREHDLTDPYWTSDERATYEAVNEANSVVSMGELQRAKELGAEKKCWRTERDNRVRFTHMRVDGKSVALDRMFEVGDALMRFPGDFVHSVRESVNCRCCLEYIDGDGNVVMVGKHGTNHEVNKTDEKVQFTEEDEHGTINVEESTQQLMIEALSPFKNPTTPLKINMNEQNKHIVGGKRYNEYIEKKGYPPSFLTITKEEMQELVDKYHGTGVLRLDKNKNIISSELILDNDKVIGTVVNNLNGEQAPTTGFKIHYSKEGTHIVPAYESQKTYWKEQREANGHDWLLRQKS